MAVTLDCQQQQKQIIDASGVPVRAYVEDSVASLPLRYFGYLGSLIATVVLVTYINRVRLGERGWMFTWQLLLIFALTAVFAVATLYRAGIVHGSFLSNTDRRYGRRHRVARFGTVAATLVALAIAALDHRLFVLLLAAIQVLILAMLHPRQRRSMLIFTGLLSAIGWALVSGLTYTHLADWLLSSEVSSLAVAAFVFSFVFVLTELDDDQTQSASLRSVFPVLFLAIAVFALYALRTDGMLANWVPYHRSFFADVAQSVKDGHWLLWDTPSLYGFLSILTLAAIPASNGWQAVYELTAAFLIIQGAISTVILRWGRSGWRNAAFAIVLPLGTLFADNIARNPWSARLYPQGGLRFFWVSVLLLIAFLMYVWRENRWAQATLRYGGHVVWLVSVFWSVDNLLWSSIVWLPYATLDSLTNPVVPVSLRSALTKLLYRLWPIAVFPLTFLASIHYIYRKALGVSPDWRSYVEFTGFFVSGKVREVFHVQDFGAGWTIILVLGAIGTLLLCCIAAKRWAPVRLLTAAWFAVWGTATYFALEPLDMYVSLLMAVLLPAMAIMIFVSREALKTDGSARFARLSVAPIAIITIALAFGEPSRLIAMKMPLSSRWTSNILQEMPPLKGELAALIDRAGIQPSDRVTVPNGPFWTELTQGLILPFTRLPNGEIVEYHSWLPISPLGPEEEIEQLSKARQQVYIERYLARTRSAGWYITYRKRAVCAALSNHLFTVRVYESTNFAAALCGYQP